MDDVRALLEVTRQHTKTARGVLRTLAGLYAQLDERLDELTAAIDNPQDAQPKEAKRDDDHQQERAQATAAA
jgi:hypothetical protein